MAWILLSPALRVSLALRERKSKDSSTRAPRICFPQSKTGALCYFAMFYMCYTEILYRRHALGKGIAEKSRSQGSRREKKSICYMTDLERQSE
jgi:hypothetical protein